MKTLQKLAKKREFSFRNTNVVLKNNNNLKDMIDLHTGFDIKAPKKNNWLSVMVISVAYYMLMIS